MPIFLFNKLVRNRIVEHQEREGIKTTSRVLSRDEHRAALVSKLTEEAQEVLDATPEEVVNELADLQQVVDDLRKLYNVTSEQVAEAQKSKVSKNGDFSEGRFISQVEILEGDPWVLYYRKNSERYNEL